MKSSGGYKLFCSGWQGFLSANANQEKAVCQNRSGNCMFSHHNKSRMQLMPARSQSTKDSIIGVAADAILRQSKVKKMKFVNKLKKFIQNVEEAKKNLAKLAKDAKALFIPKEERARLLQIYSQLFCSNMECDVVNENQLPKSTNEKQVYIKIPQQILYINFIRLILTMMNCQHW